MIILFNEIIEQVRASFPTKSVNFMVILVIKYLIRVYDYSLFFRECVKQ